MKWLSVILFLVAMLGSSASAYEFSTGKLFLRSVMGPLIHAARFDAIASEATPLAGFVMGIEGEWIVQRPWSLVGAFRPTFASGAIELGMGAGVRYRWDDLGMPLIINASLQLTPSVLVPFGDGMNHFNLGLRHSVGFDYFLMRDLVVGAEFAFDPSWLMTEKIKSFEASVEILASLMVKI